MNLPIAGNEFVCFSKYLCSSFLMWPFVPGKKGKVFLPLEKQVSDVHQTHKLKLNFNWPTEQKPPLHLLHCFCLYLFPRQTPLELHVNSFEIKTQAQTQETCIGSRARPAALTFVPMSPWFTLVKKARVQGDIRMSNAAQLLSLSLYSF